MAEASVPARAALAGNPSDGYGGRVVAVLVPELSARVSAEPADGVMLRVVGQGERRFASLEEALATPPVCDGPGLLHAALRRALAVGTAVPGGGVALNGATTIPTEVGLASSSALVVATLRALETNLGQVELARLALAAEVDELGVSAGMQDRLVQVMGGPLDMDFERETNELLDAPVPDLLIAWRPSAAASSGVLHGDLRSRYEAGETEVLDAMRLLAECAARARQALESGDHAMLRDAMDSSFDARAGIGATDELTAGMVATARAGGGSANSAGSGGAIVAAAEDLNAVERALRDAGCETLVHPVGAPG